MTIVPPITTQAGKRTNRKSKAAQAAAAAAVAAAAQSMQDQINMVNIELATNISLASMCRTFY